MNTSEQLWAIKVPFEDGWLYVTKHNPNGDIGKGTDIVIRTFNSKQEAERNAKIWKTSEVVPYSSDN